MDKSKDQDRVTGTIEQDQQDHGGGNTNLNGELGHRDEDSGVEERRLGFVPGETLAGDRHPCSASVDH